MNAGLKVGPMFMFICLHFLSQLNDHGKLWVSRPGQWRTTSLLITMNVEQATEGAERLKVG